MDYCPLSGKPCNKAKNFNITEVVNNDSQSFSLCQDCAAQYMSGQKTQSEIREEHVPELPPAGNPPAQNGADLLNQFMHDFFGPNAPQFKPAGGQGVPAKKPQAPPRKPPCPHCGATIQDIASSGRLGCLHCYDHYGPEIEPVLRHAQGEQLQHVGKVPKKWAEKQQMEEKLKKAPKDYPQLKGWLKRMMKDAIEVEDYEKAAKIRDSLEEVGNLEKKKAVLKQKMNIAVSHEQYDEAKTISEELTEIAKRFGDIVMDFQEESEE